MYIIKFFIQTQNPTKPKRNRLVSVFLGYDKRDIIYNPKNNIQSEKREITLPTVIGNVSVC